MKKIVLFLFLIVTTSNLFGQELPEIVSQTPEAAALSKYSEYPVGTFTGVPSINVPLYTINSGDISLPIGLNYHAGGFRVSEESSWVGLGWTLSANFAITRTVKGAEDFNGNILSTYHNIGSTPNNGSTPWIIDIIEGCLSDNCTVYDTPEAPGGNGFDSSDLRLPAFSGAHSTIAEVGGQTYSYQSYSGWAFDWEPDVYSINVLGLNAKFVMDQHQNVHFIEKKDLEISKILNGWVAKTNDGFQYYFEKKETTLNSYGKELNGSWYITKIISPTKREMNFFYDVDIDYSWQYSYSETATVTGNYITNPSFSAYPNPLSQTRHKNVYLKRIEFDNGYVNFTRDVVLREDLKGAKRLKSIEIFDKNDKLIKEFEFVTSYFESNNNSTGYYNQHLLDTNEFSYYTKRLKLNKVIERNSSLSKEHRFNYSSINLPNKNSFSVDHWGYYNGRSNSHLISTFEGKLSLEKYYPNICASPFAYSTTTKYCRYQGSNRTTNPSTVNANILKEIIYPTGGKTSFEFEANEYEARLSEEFEYVDYSEHVRKTAMNGATDTYTYSTNFPFDFPDDVLSIHDSKVELVVYANDTNPNGISFTSNMYFEINSPSYSQTYSFDQYYSGQSLSHTDTNLPDNFQGPVNLSITMPESNENKTAIITFRCKLKKESSKKYAGGLRIKKITHSDNSNNPDVVKTYAYNYTVIDTNGVLQNKTYGKLKVPVKYWNSVPINPGELNNKINFSSSTAFGLSMFQNSHIGYSKVIEKIGENGENGKNIYNYTNHTNIAYNDNGRPPGVPNSVSIVFDGKLNRKTSYDNQDKIISEESYNYNILDEKIVKGIYQDGYNSCGIIYGRGRFHYYPIFSRWEPMVSQTQRTYNPNDTNYVETLTTYSYNDENLLPSEVTTTDSNGNTLKTKNYYPMDVTDGVNLDDLGELLTTNEYNAIDKLKRVTSNGQDGDFKTSQPVQVETYKNNNLLSTQRTNYRTWGNNGLTLPEFVQTLKGSYSATNVLQDRIQYKEYGEFGNPIKLSKIDGIDISYIWGYNDQYPIAKIENANYSQVSTYVANLEIKSNADNDRTLNYTGNEGALRQDLDALRAALPNAMVTTYTYDPLIGVTSVTDPKGYTIYYEYDEFNRLQFVKDDEGKLVSENKYHYKD